jgi:hypothetical protein
MGCVREGVSSIAAEPQRGSTAQPAQHTSKDEKQSSVLKSTYDHEAGAESNPNQEVILKYW